MPDIVSQVVRSRMMAGIRGKDTRSELAIRRGMHARGFRFRLHVATLPGKPDLVFPRFRAVLFAHGCFWHGHDCHLFKWPSTRAEFWRQKIGRNREVDTRNERCLKEAGWRIGVIWECAMKGKTRRPEDEVFDAVQDWLNGTLPVLELSGGPL